MTNPSHILPVIHQRTAPKASTLRRIFHKVVEWDYRYRQAHKLRNMSDERLDDMGLTRRDANTAFRR